MPFDLLPEWATFRARPEAEQLRILRDDPAERERLIDAARNADYSGWSGVGAQAAPPDFEGIRVYEQGLPPNPTVVDLARGGASTRSS